MKTLLFISALSLTLSSCTMLMTTSSPTYSDDVYGVYNPAPPQTAQRPAQSQNEGVDVYDSEGNTGSRLNGQNYDDGNSDEVIVDDSYTTRIYRFHRPTRAVSYYDVVICEPWYHNWY